MTTVINKVMKNLGRNTEEDQSREYIMSLDAGTTSVRAVLFDEYGCVVAQAQRDLTMIYPEPGWVEQDPIEILSRQIACMIEVQFKSGIHSDKIRAVGITNQRETVVVWDKNTGQPIYNAIVWQCRRTAPVIQKLKEEGYTDVIRSRTGLIPDPYFSATKIAWILDNVEGAREMAQEGSLICGTIDTWLIYNLTHGQVHATDYTNASRTMLFDINTLTWDVELCDLFGVPVELLPAVQLSQSNFGRVSSDIMTNHPPIAGVAGDQQASLYGHCCFNPGQVKNTYGTGCFMLMNLGDKPILSEHGLVTTIGIADEDGISYALEGSVFQAGSVIQWLRDELHMINSASETEAIATSIDSNDGCYFVPAFTGLGAPWWDSSARGIISGITRGTNRAVLVRAACESMCYQTYDVLKAMEKDCKKDLVCLNVDGGAARNNFIMQFQSDLLNIKICRSNLQETTALGAAYLAGISVGFWKDKDELVGMRAHADKFMPEMDEHTKEVLLAGWHKAVAQTIGRR